MTGAKGTLSTATALGGIFSALLFASVWWFWFVGYDRPSIQNRYHDFGTHLLAGVLTDNPGEYRGASFNPNTIPVVAGGKQLARTFGISLKTLLFVQLPILAVLLLSVGAVAWRVGGPMAAGMAPWVALAAPATMGTSFEFNELLSMQAFTAAGIALVAWSDQNRKAWLALAAVLPMTLAIRSGYVPSNVQLALMTYGLASAAFVASGWIRCERTGDAQSPAPAIFWLMGIAVLAAYLVVVRFPMFDAPSTAGQILNSDRQGLVWTEVLFAYPLQWIRLHVGPVAAVGCLTAIAFFICRRQMAAVWPILVWLLAPMAILSLIPKRNDYYLLSAVPATYPLIAIAAAKLRSRKAGWLVLLLFAAASVFWYFPRVFPEEKGGEGPGRQLLRIASVNRWLMKINNYGFYDCPPFHYTHSPFEMENSIEALSRSVRNQCTEKGRGLMLLALWGKGKETGDFLLWFQNRDLPAEYWFHPSAPELQGRCILVNLSVDMEETSTPRAILSMVDRLPEAFSEEEQVYMKQRLDRLTESVDDYVVGWIERGQYALLVPGSD